MNKLRYTLFALLASLYIGQHPLQASSDDNQSNKISRSPSPIAFNNQPGLSLKNIMSRINQLNLNVNNLTQDNRQFKKDNDQLKLDVNKLTQENREFKQNNTQLNLKVNNLNFKINKLTH